MKSKWKRLRLKNGIVRKITDYALPLRQPEMALTKFVDTISVIQIRRLTSPNNHVTHDHTAESYRSPYANLLKLKSQASQP